MRASISLNCWLVRPASPLKAFSFNSLRPFHILQLLNCVTLFVARETYAPAGTAQCRVGHPIRQLSSVLVFYVFLAGLALPAPICTNSSSGPLLLPCGPLLSFQLGQCRWMFSLFGVYDELLPQKFQSYRGISVYRELILLTAAVYRQLRLSSFFIAIYCWSLCWSEG